MDRDTEDKKPAVPRRTKGHEEGHGDRSSSRTDSSGVGEVAKARWSLLRQVLRRSAADGREVKQVSVRRFATFDLFSRKWPVTQDPNDASDGQWVEYTSVYFPEYSALLRDSQGPLRVTEVLTSFDNTGNVSAMQLTGALPPRQSHQQNKKYQVQTVLGTGVFGNVVRCMNLKDKRTVAIKMVELQDSTAKMAYKEVDTLRKLRPLDPNKSNIVRWNQHFVDRGHLCLVFECLDKNLMEYMKDREFRPLLLREIRPVVQQIANALKHLKALRIVHADLKLENVMWVDQVRQPFRVKVIDFGLSCKASDARLKSYIQTLPYRSPEILLGHPFFEAIDMWSLGCMAAALYLGTLLYPGLGEYEMLWFIIETQGRLSQAMLNSGRKTPKYFRYAVTNTCCFWKLKTPEMYRKETGKQPVENRTLKFSSLDRIVDVRPVNTCNPENKAAEMADMHMFVDMLKKMLHLDPKRRITPQQLLEHRFISMLHIVGMDTQSNYVRSCFQTMELCQTKRAREHLGTPRTSAQPRPTAARVPATPVQQNPPSHAQSGTMDPPQSGEEPPPLVVHPTWTKASGRVKVSKYKSCTSRASSRSCHNELVQRARPPCHHHRRQRCQQHTQRVLSAQSEHHHDHDVLPLEKSSPPRQTDTDGPGRRDCLDCAGGISCSHESWHHLHQPDQTASSGPSSPTWTERQAQSELKRRGSNLEEEPLQKTCWDTGRWLVDTCGHSQSVQADLTVEMIFGTLATFSGTTGPTTGLTASPFLSDGDSVTVACGSHVHHNRATQGSGPTNCFNIAEVRSVTEPLRTELDVEA